MLPLDWHNETFTLLHDRAVHWPRTDTTIVSDLHFGKAETFRRAGIPMPRGTTQDTLNRLTRLIEKTQPQRLLILGDFMHARQGVTEALIEQLTEWRRHHANLHITLVRGNHDRNAGDPPQELAIETVEEPMIDQSIAFCHEFDKCNDADKPAMGGHVHPVFTLRDRAGGGGSIRSACFVVSEREFLLPAFGSFTGGAQMKRLPDRRIFLIGPGEVIELPRVAIASRM